MNTYLLILVLCAVVESLPTNKAAENLETQVENPIRKDLYPSYKSSFKQKENVAVEDKETYLKNTENSLKLENSELENTEPNDDAIEAVERIDKSVVVKRNEYRGEIQENIPKESSIIQEELIDNKDGTKIIILSRKTEITPTNTDGILQNKASTKSEADIKMNRLPFDFRSSLVDIDNQVRQRPLLLPVPPITSSAPEEMVVAASDNSVILVPLSDGNMDSVKGQDSILLKRDVNTNPSPRSKTPLGSPILVGGVDEFILPNQEERQPCKDCMDDSNLDEESVVLKREDNDKIKSSDIASDSDVNSEATDESISSGKVVGIRRFDDNNNMMNKEVGDADEQLERSEDGVREESNYENANSGNVVVQVKFPERSNMAEALETLQEQNPLYRLEPPSSGLTNKNSNDKLMNGPNKIQSASIEKSKLQDTGLQVSAAGGDVPVDKENMKETDMDEQTEEVISAQKTEEDMEEDEKLLLRNSKNSDTENNEEEKETQEK